MIKAVIFDLDGTLYEPRFFPLRLILADRAPYPENKGNSLHDRGEAL